MTSAAAAEPLSGGKDGVQPALRLLEAAKTAGEFDEASRNRKLLGVFCSKFSEEAVTGQFPDEVFTLAKRLGIPEHPKLVLFGVWLVRASLKGVEFEATERELELKAKLDKLHTEVAAYVAASDKA